MTGELSPEERQRLLIVQLKMGMCDCTHLNSGRAMLRMAERQQISDTLVQAWLDHVRIRHGAT